MDIFTPSCENESSSGNDEELISLLHDKSELCGDALQSYLRQIGQLPNITNERRNDLLAELLNSEDKLRQELYKVGFVLNEHIRLVDEALYDNNFSSIFQPSSLKKDSSKNLNEELKKWSQSLKKAAKKFTDTFTKTHAQTKDNQSEIVAIQSEYLVVADILEEWVHVLDEMFILHPISDEHHCNLKNNREYIENKVLMPLDDYIQLYQKIKNAHENLLETRKNMLEANLKLVIGVANRYRYRNRTIPISDLIQEGNLGLLRALEKFDFHYGHKFSTYAIWWVKQNIIRAIAEQSRIIRIPAHMISTLSAMNNAEQMFILENGREPEVEELAELLKLSVARVSALQKMARQTISLQAPSGKSESGSLEDTIEDNNEPIPSQRISNKIMVQQIKELLNTLPQREQEIIVMRFGLFGSSPHTLLEVSKHFNLTRERIRQLEIRILNKLRSPEYLKFFDSDFTGDDLN